MVTTVFVKILTGHLINSRKNLIALVDKDRKHSLGQLKTAQAQKKVAGKNKAVLEAKKKKMMKKEKELQTQLKGFEQEAKRRRQKGEELKSQLIR